MRVIAGRFGGRRLRAPRGAGVRPTSERVREALFSALEPVEGARVLDLFAGTGALGIEALSRGASRAVFVESAHHALEVLRANLASLALGETEARVCPGDARAALRRLAASGERFDLVFMDPPYAAGLLASVLQAVVQARILAAGARVVVESSRRHPVPAVEGLSPIDARRYGDTTLTQLAAAGSPPVSADETGGPPHA
ncbi:MAG TPA: 16S rRNA (guanine(966)-N(2))-methyltransferase RsmD [Myxococcota bacterium]|jgi:16S rRNA (guanine(966)-N(2))-methyltransferase RsmD|nr:16S rRNA (guanine(966)-N(2))-methyltransferase RsmD [Myxococcota bacterium]